MIKSALAKDMLWPIVIHKDPNSDYGVTVPDLPGCFSVGSSYEDAFVQAKEAISLHLEGLASDGDPIPSPLPLAEHIQNPEYADGIPALIELSMKVAA
ncbi:MAG: type II toxin-antitoxin system HicB family antitoxin [Cyanobacteria bacterium P01_A01_bin.114]